MLVTWYRGKASEGLDLRDDLCRVVVCVGIPFPPFVDNEIEEKNNEEILAMFDLASIRVELTIA